MTVSSDELPCGRGALEVATWLSDPDSQAGEAVETEPELLAPVSPALIEGMAGYAALCGGWAEADEAGFTVAAGADTVSVGAVIKISFVVVLNVSGVVDIAGIGRLQTRASPAGCLQYQ